MLTSFDWVEIIAPSTRLAVNRKYHQLPLITAWRAVYIILIEAAVLMIETPSTTHNSELLVGGMTFNTGK